MVRHPSFQGLPWRYEFRQDLPVIPSVTIDADATEQPSVQHGAHPILPMASGHLTHPSWDSDSKRGTTDGTMRNKYDQARAQDMPIIERVHGLAERLGVPMARIALAWHWAKDVTAPIVGCSKTERVDDVIEALGVKLSESDIAYLEEPYTAHELVGPLARPGERALAGTLAPTLKEKAK